MAVLALMAGCDGIALDPLLEQHAPLTRITSEPAGGNCAHGGSAVLTGLDLDDDGVLSDAEVRSTEYVCASATPGVLLRTQQVLPGQRCALGGQVSRVGLDVDGDGELGAGEVLREVVSCTKPETVVTRLSALPGPSEDCPQEGTRVEAGLDLNRNGTLDDPERRAMGVVCAAPALVQVREAVEPTGATCPSGGTRVEAGTDGDGDTVFEDHEVVATAVVCNALRTYGGSYVVTSAADLAALEGISRIQGSLQVVSASVTDVVLPELMMVEGQLLIDGNTTLKRVELPGLRFVEQDLLVSANAGLESLGVGRAGSVVWVGKNLTVEKNARLATLAGLDPVVPGGNVTLWDNDALRVPGTFDSVVELAGSIAIWDNDVLQALPFANLERLGGGLSIANNPALPSLEGTRLSSVAGNVSLSDNDALTDLSGLPRLESIGGGLLIEGNDQLRTTAGMQALSRVGWLNISRNAGLERAASFPVLRTVATSLVIHGNASLVSVGDLRFLQHLQGLTLSDNPKLTDLTELGEVQTLGTLWVQNNAALTSLDALSQLRALDTLRVVSNEALTRLMLPALERVKFTFTVVDNPRLPTCLATSLATRTFTGTGAVIAGNDSTTPCE
jgi:hypothetical protein